MILKDPPVAILAQAILIQICLAQVGPLTIPNKPSCPMRFLLCTILLATACGMNMILKDPPKSLSQQAIEKMQFDIQASAGDSAALFKSCAALEAIGSTQREGPGPYGGRRISTALLEAGIGEAFAQGVLNSVAIDVAENKTSPSAASSRCLNGITGLTVQNDYDKGLALINNAPNVWNAVIKFYEAFDGSEETRNGFWVFAGLFGTPQPAEAAAAEVAAGAVDFIMRHFENKSLKSDPAMFQRVWCALSDPVHETSGVFARAMANYAGHLQGIPVLVDALQLSMESDSTFHEGNGFGLLYEAIHVIGGVMEHDDSSKTFARTFVQAGLVPLMVPLMKKEPDDNLLQDMSCEAIKWITDDNVAVQGQLVKEGAIEVIAKAFIKFTHPPIHGYGMVACTCSAALLNFALGSTAWQDEMLKLGILDALDVGVFTSFPRDGADDFFPRAKDFPNSNLYRLKEVLEQRKQS